MIRRITLENYMAHVRTVIDLADGLTVLIGPNNCGKSAIVHALEMVCYNAEAADFAIRHGTKKAIVTVETEDPDGTKHTVVWWRKKGTAGYIIDGREITGLGLRGVPHDLHSLLKMPKVEPAAGGDPFFLHFGLQKSPIFLLNESESRAAHFFASSSDADKLVEMQKLHASKTQNARQNKERLNREIARLDEKLSILEPVPAALAAVDELEATYAILLGQQRRLAELEQATVCLLTAFEIAARQVSRKQALDALNPPPVLDEAVPLAELIRSSQAASEKAAQNAAIGTSLSTLDSPPPLQVTTHLAVLCDQAGNAADQLAAHAAWIAALSSLKGVPALEDDASLCAALGAIDVAGKALFQCDGRQTALSSIAAPPTLEDAEALSRLAMQMSSAAVRAACIAAQQHDLKGLRELQNPADVSPLQQMIAAIERADAERINHRARLTGAEAELSAATEQIERWVLQNPRCQTCGQDITAELFLLGGHTHA